MSSEFTDNVITEFRANDGHVGGDLAGTPIILIHHIGARTRTERVTPLAYSSQADGGLVIAASNGGSPAHPTWYHNLKAHPTIEVELGAETFTALAEEVTGAARAELWPKLVAASPALDEFQAKTARRIPLFTLTRRSRSAFEPRLAALRRSVFFPARTEPTYRAGGSRLQACRRPRSLGSARPGRWMSARPRANPGRAESLPMVARFSARPWERASVTGSGA